MAAVTGLGYASSVRHPMSAAIVLTLGLLLSAGASAAQPRRCATTALLHLPGGAGFAVGINDRPAALDVVDSATLPVRVHRTAAATPAQAAVVLQALEAAWAVQVDGAGFAPPLGDDGEGGDDGLDVYLSPLPGGVSAVTVSGDDVDDDTTRDVRSAFVVIDPRQPDELLAVAAHHEFQHVLQFGIDADESVMWFEATAVAFEVRGRPDLTSWQEALPPFQTQPQAPLGADSVSFAPFATSTDDRLEYGAALFALYLDDTFGDGDGRVLRELWTAAAGSTDDDDDDDDDSNEPDWRDALELLGDPADIQRDFLAWRALAPPLSVVGKGPSAYALGGGAGLRGKRIVLENLAGTTRTTVPAEGPFAGGCLVLSGTAGNAAAPVYVRVESPQHIGVMALVIGNNRVERSDRDGNGVVTLDVVVPAGRELVLGVCDLSPWDADAAPVFSPVRLTIDDAPIVDRGTEGEGEGEGEGEDGGDVIDPGCGCDSTSTGPAAGDPRAMRKGMYTAGFFIGIFGFVMKAWRHLRRRRLYKQSKARRP